MIFFGKKLSYIRWVIIIIGLLIGIGSVLYTNYIVDILAKRERAQIDLFAKVQELIVTAGDNQSSQFLLTEIIEANTSIPVILADENKQPVYWRNLDIDENLPEEKLNALLLEELSLMEKQHQPIAIDLSEAMGFPLKQYIYYENSKLITQLTYYPYIQLSIIAIFSLFVYFIYSSSRNSEQNRVWVGLAKETAHQLGTPLSSLMGWLAFFQADEHFDKSVLEELEKDVEKLSIITSRFSNIGSIPVLKTEDIFEHVDQIVSYLQKRISPKISIEIIPDITQNLEAPINASLFGWVIENLCKNAVDAMVDHGKITIKVRHSKDGKMIQIDITDTGKGIPKSMFKKVFYPGFTTKKRGWGLGLTLVKRIIENYHKGKIYVQRSELNVGTTFRIMLPRSKSQKNISKYIFPFLNIKKS